MAYASSLTISNGTLGVSQSWSISSELSSYKHTLVAKSGSYSKTIISNSTTKSGTWTPPLEWANVNKTGTTVQIKFTLTTYTSSGSKIGSRERILLYEIPDDVIPSVSIKVSDPTGYADKTNGNYIKNISKVKAVITAAGVYGSTIRSYRATFCGKTYTAADFTTDVIPTSGHPTVDVSVVDSRGRRATTSIEIPVIAYASPAITAFSVTRCADAEGNGTSGGFLKVSFSSIVYDLLWNGAAYALKYKKTTDTEYTTVDLSAYDDHFTEENGVYVFAADSASSYNVTLTVTDDISSTSKTAIGASSYKLWSIFGKGLGFAFGKIAELAGVLDIAFQTKFTGGVMHPVLEANTDLNDVMIPNTYAGKNANSAGYLNIPFTSGTFTLTVEEAGDNGQIRQIITLCDKTISRVWERFYYGGAWGEWICTSGLAGKVLWSGASYMHGTQTINLSEPISKQPSGVVFVWGWYDYSKNETVNAEFHYFFVPKYHVANFPGKTVTMADYYVEVKKQLYVYDEQIVGYPTNDKEGTDTLTGLAYNNKTMVLRAVIGV